MLLIKVKETGAYKGGHYFGEMKLQTDKGKEVEYWECEKCFNED